MGAMYLEEQLARIRAGRANVAILDGVRVSSWGSMVPLNQVANVTVPDPRTIAIRPFDKKQIREIEKAIMDSDVGITPENNGEIIRLGIPQPTEERRKELVKSVRKKAEESKVAIRAIRRDANEAIKKDCKDSVITEDDQKRLEDKAQKATDAAIKDIDRICSEKEKELLEV